MYNSNNRQYIFRQSSGKVWNLYHDEKLGLCYSTLTKRSTWTEPVSLHKNLHPVFFADIDFDDCFHILFQDKQGNIFLSRLYNSSIKTIPVLNSKAPVSYNKYLSLIPARNESHFFFIIQHNDSSILAHQILRGDTVSTPRVIDYVAKSNCPYSVIGDKSGNIYAFYQSSSGESLQIGYKKYNSDQNFWSDFSFITNHSGNCEFPRAIVDNKNIMHICYQRHSLKQYELVYQQKVPDKNIWSDEIIVHSSVHSFYDSSVVCSGESTIVYWVRDDVIYYSSSTDGGAVWSKPARHNFVPSKQLMCMTYKTNQSIENEKLAASSLPGCFINGFKLAFYQEPTVSTHNITADELKTMLLDGLKLLKDNVEELKDSNSDMRKSIQELSVAHQNLEMEMTKNAVKLNFLEDDTKQIQQISSQLENYSGILNDFISKPGSGLPDFEEMKNSIIQEITTGSELSKYSLDISRLRNELNDFKKYLGKRKLKYTTSNKGRRKKIFKRI